MIPTEPVAPTPTPDGLDDEALTTRALKKHNIANQIAVVRNGAEALDWLLARGIHQDRNVEDQPALVLLDLKLPKMDGLEVLRSIRRDERTKHLPVVILTSSDEQKDVVESYSLGANAYVRKPVDFGQFSEAVRQLGLFWIVVNEPPLTRGS